MKLLLDENLSYRMLTELESAFPGPDHVTKLGLQTSSDRARWDFARERGFTLGVSE